MGWIVYCRKTIKLLKARGDAMQNAVPKGEGGMVAVLGTSIKVIEKILNDNKDNFNVEIANDNCVGQIVLSGKNKDLDKLFLFLKSKNIRNIKLPVSAPFHCGLMSKATEVMKNINVYIYISLRFFIHFQWHGSQTHTLLQAF